MTVATSDNGHQTDAGERGDRWSKLPPQDIPAEQAVLGAMMMSPAVADEIGERLRPSDFYRPVHATIFDVIVTLSGRGEPPDARVVAAELDRIGELARVGGVPYLHTLLEAPPTAANGSWYANIVADKSGRRRLVEAGTATAQLAVGPEDLPAVQERAAQIMYEATTDERDRAIIESVGDLAGPTIEHVEDVAAGRIAPGIMTGLSDYDRMTGGHKPGELIIPAGRTSMGKSVLTQNWLLHGVESTMRPGILFSVEMSKREMMQRLLSEMSGVSYSAIREGRISDEDRVKLRDAERRLLLLPLYFVDNIRTVPAIRSYCRRFRQRLGDLALIGVDYLQRLQAVGRAVDRHEVVGQFADDLKTLGQDMAMPVIAPCQLNRGPETRTGKNANIPKLSDLRESGNLEQTADNVVLIHRPDYYDKESTRKGQADLIVAKHRNGPTDTITVRAELYRQRFLDMPVLEPRPWD